LIAESSSRSTARSCSRASISPSSTPILLLFTTLLSCCSTGAPPRAQPAPPIAAPAPPPPDSPERPKEQPVEPCLVYPTRHARTNGRGPRNAATAQSELQRGLSLASSGNHFAALEAFDSALAADPYHGLTHLAKAESHLFTDNDPAKMRMHLATAVLLMPENPRAHSRLADFLAEAGEADAAITHWKCALTLKSSYDEARLNLARYLVTLKRASEAEAELRSIEGGLDDVTVLALLADALAGQGKLLEAARQAEEAARHAGPSAASLLRRAGDLYEAADSPLSANRVRAKADRLDPPPRERKMRPLKRRKKR
jgi:tetratricopeptide (TPR) repeat protein